jgi:hypothetical protein
LEEWKWRAAITRTELKVENKELDFRQSSPWEAEGSFLE